MPLNNIFNELKKDKIICVDVGARWGITEPWIHFGDIVNVIGFEPDGAECKKLNAQARKKDMFIKYLPVALLDGKKDATLNITKSPGCSSLLRPNKKILNQFPDAGRFDIVNETQIHTNSLDSVLEENRIENIDFVKVDTQGTELNILQGAEQALSKDVFGIAVEVEFIQLYEGQPLFADVDVYLRENGFTLFDLNRHRWKRKNIPANMPSRGQIIFGDALYLRTDFGEDIKSISRIKGLKMIMIAALHGYYDYGRYLNESFLEYGIFSQEDKNQIDQLLCIKPISQVKRVNGLFKKFVINVLRPRGIQNEWAGSDGFEIGIYINDLRIKISKLTNEGT
jgi:FkbM family methyltransferase